MLKERIKRSFVDFEENKEETRLFRAAVAFIGVWLGFGLKSEKKSTKRMMGDLECKAKVVVAFAEKKI